MSLSLICLFTFLPTVYSVGGHCKNYTKPHEQRYSLRIIFLPFLFSFLATIGYYYPETSIFFWIAMDFWETIVIYSFFKLLIAYLGPKGSLHTVLQKKGTKRLCCGLLDPSSLMYIKTLELSVLQ